MKHGPEPSGWFRAICGVTVKCPFCLTKGWAVPVRPFRVPSRGHPLWEWVLCIYYIFVIIYLWDISSRI